MKSKISSLGVAIFLLFIISCSKQDPSPFSSFKVKINNITYQPKVYTAFTKNTQDTTVNLYIQAYDSNKNREIDFNIYTYKGTTGNYLYPTAPIYPYSPFQTYFDIYYSDFIGNYITVRYGQMKLLEADKNHIKGTFSFTLDDSTHFTEGEFYLIMKR